MASSQKAIDHYIGSQAFIAAARIGHLCIEEMDTDEKPTGRILFTNPKNNPAEKQPTLAYRIQNVTIGQDPTTLQSIMAPYVVWGGTVQITADQAVAAAAKGGRPGRADEAKEFLQTALANGPVPIKDLQEAARAHGLTPDQLRRAKEKLTIKVYKNGLGGWLWKLELEPL